MVGWLVTILLSLAVWLVMVFVDVVAPSPDPVAGPWRDLWLRQGWVVMLIVGALAYGSVRLLRRLGTGSGAGTLPR